MVEINTPSAPRAEPVEPIFQPIAMPRRVRVGPFRFKLGYLDPVMAAQAGLYGQYQGSNLTIGVLKDLPSGRQGETCLHEVLHAIWDTTGLRNLTSDTCPEEEIVTMLSQALAGVMRDNPEFIAWLVQQLTLDEDDDGEGEGGDI